MGTKWLPKFVKCSKHHYSNPLLQPTTKDWELIDVINETETLKNAPWCQNVYSTRFWKHIFVATVWKLTPFCRMTLAVISVKWIFGASVARSVCRKWKELSGGWTSLQFEQLRFGRKKEICNANPFRGKDVNFDILRTRQELIIFPRNICYRTTADILLISWTFLIWEEFLRFFSCRKRRRCRLFLRVDCLMKTAATKKIKKHEVKLRSLSQTRRKRWTVTCVRWHASSKWLVDSCPEMHVIRCILNLDKRHEVFRLV